MVGKRSPPFYLFKCPKCGEYKVEETTFWKFIPESKKAQIQKEINQRRNGAIGAFAEFSKICPKCSPEQGTDIGEFGVLRLNLSQRFFS